MAALGTVQKIIDSARILLQDRIAPFRYPDTDLIAALNEGVLEARRLRPDLFLPTFDVPEYTAVGDAVTFELMYRPALVMYVAGKTQLQDDEETQDGRATSFLNAFTSKMLVIAS